MRSPIANVRHTPAFAFALAFSLALALALALAAGLAAGCSGRPPKPIPQALETAQGLARQAATLQAAGNWRAAADRWKRAGQEFLLLNEQGHAAVALHNEGVCRAQAGDPAGARVLLIQALDLNRRLDRPDEAWRNQIALLQLEVSADPPSALQRAVSLQDSRTPDLAPPLRALLDLETARAQFANRLSDDALASASRAETGFSAVGDTLGAASAAVLRARILDREGRWPESESVWRMVLGRFQEGADPKGIAVALAGLGICLTAQEKDPAEAEALVMQAAQNLRTLGMQEASEAVLAEFQQLKGGAVSR